MRAITKSNALVLSLLLGLGWWSGCSEVGENAALPTGPAAKVHVQGWADLSTSQFLHAQEIEKNQGSTTSCQLCHGEDYQGKGDAALSCFTCHSDPAKGRIHADGWIDPAAKQTFHGDAVRARNFDMSSCRSCHGADYAGGVVQNSCLKCHAGTPESCTTCHGSGDNLAPPKDTGGNTETRFFGVGAHQAHLRQGKIAAALNCTDCHHFPQGFADPAHVDGDGRAELNFGPRASANGNTPSYDPQTHTCAGTYCHGGGKLGNQAVPGWTEVGSGQAACSACHGLPPGKDTGHPPVAAPLTCATCHSRVVDADNNILDTTLHLNGQTDF